MKLNQFVYKKNVTIISVPIKRIFKRYCSNQHFLRVLPARWRRKPAGIDTERNYVTVTLSIAIPNYISVLSVCLLPNPCKRTR